MKKLFGFALMFALLTFVTSCGNQPKADSNENVSEKEAIEKTRSMNAAQSSKVAAAYNYKSLATFNKGEYSGTMTLNELGKLEGKNVNLVVLYDTEAPWAEVFNGGDVSKTGDDNFNGLMSSYNLSIVKQFELDEFNEGLVLEPNGEIGDPVQAAREISMIDYVLMVHVKEVPAEEVSADIDND